MPDIIYLVRHAAPPPDKRGRYWGRADPGVDPDELAKIAFLANRIEHKPARLLSSPLRRAVDTAGELAAAFRVDIEVDGDLAEVDFGRFDGLSWSEVERRHPKEAGEWMEKADYFSFPGGESIQDFFHRVTGAWKRVCAMEERALLAVAHGGVLSAWLCLFLRLPLSARFRFPAACGALAALENRNGEWNLDFFNDRG